MVNNADITKDTSLADVAQISSSLSAATTVPNEISEKTDVGRLSIERFLIECRKKVISRLLWFGFALLHL